MNIEISYTAATLNAVDNYTSPANRNGTLGGVLDSFLAVNYVLNNSYATFYNYSLTQTQLTLGHIDGTVSTYRGTLDNPSATSGYATVTNRSISVPNVLTYTESGESRYVYASNSSGYLQSFSAVSGTLSAVQMQTRLPTYSSDYNKTFGNLSSRLEGNIQFNQRLDISGTLTKIDSVFEKLVSRQVYEGNFKVTGNLIQVGQGLQESQVTGSMTRYSEAYFDGSYVRITSQTGFPISPDTTIGRELLARASLFPESDVISINLPSAPQKPWVLATGNGNDRITINGGGSGKVTIDAGNGNDYILSSNGSHLILGGDGLDTLSLLGTRSSYQVQKQSSSTATTVGDTQNTLQLSEIERISFRDVSLALDVDGNAGEAFRIYKAAFNRQPDTGGLGYWIAQLDSGMDLLEVARRFIDSTEFKTLYGASPNNESFLRAVYTNVLGRNPDPEGFSWWLNAMNTDPTKTREKVLADFSESPENVLATTPLVITGIEYNPWNG